MRCFGPWPLVATHQPPVHTMSPLKKIGFALAVLTVEFLPILTVAPSAAHAAKLCPSGLVWRERFDGDTVCVLPGERDHNRRRRGRATEPAPLCPSGLLARERFASDS